MQPKKVIGIVKPKHRLQTKIFFLLLVWNDSLLLIFSKTPLQTAWTLFR